MYAKTFNMCVAFYLLICLLGMSVSNDVEFSRHFAKRGHMDPQQATNVTHQNLSKIICPVAVQECRTSPVTIEFCIILFCFCEKQIENKSKHILS